MRSRRVLAVFCVLMACASPARAGMDGYVFLYPMDSSFRSEGKAVYVNALSQVVREAVITGNHRVTGPLMYESRFEVVERYFYNLEGPADPGACYGTTLYAWSDPPGPDGRDDETWTGDTRCAPVPQRSYIISQLCPLLLDLNGDGIHTTGLESPVFFWSVDGRRTYSGWTDPGTEEAFLWLDSEIDRDANEQELFGSRMPAPDGTVHRNGFQALEKYDLAEFGGDGDGRITASDRVWGRLRLWIDRNHNGTVDGDESLPPSAQRIVALNLERAHDHSPYPNGNSLMLVGSYVRRSTAGEWEERAMVDVGFIYAP